MENVIFSVKMLAALMKASISELAVNAGISPDHLLSVSSGRTKMTADDVVKLSTLTGIPAQNIEH